MFDMAGMFPGGDMMGMGGILGQAAQDPQLQQQLIPMLAASGVEPPQLPEQPSPFFDLPPGGGGMEFGSSERRDRVATPPAGSLPDIPGAIGGAVQSGISAIPTPGKLAGQYAPDMANWGATPEAAGVPTPPTNPFATPGVFAGIPGAAPTPPGAAMAPAGAPPAPMASSLPFPTPMGDAGGNPFPTPIGSPAGGPTPAKPDMATLGKMLQGVKAPAAPEAQRVSTPSAPQPRGIDQNSPLSQMIAKLLMGGGGDPVAQLRLSQALK